MDQFKTGITKNWHRNDNLRLFLYLKKNTVYSLYLYLLVEYDFSFTVKVKNFTVNYCVIVIAYHIHCKMLKYCEKSFQILLVSYQPQLLFYFELI